jgi:hypothetical protein
MSEMTDAGSTTTERTAEVVRAEIETVTVDRAQSSGTAKSAHTRKLKVLTAELALLTATDLGCDAPSAGGHVAAIVKAGEKVKIDALVEAVAADLRERQLDADRDTVVRLGEPVIASNLLAFYTPARYSGGRWCGQATVQRVQKLCPAGR